MPSWLDLLRAEVAVSSVTSAARRIGVSRSALSQVLNACGPYGTGRASVARIAERVMQEFGQVACPFLSEFKGELVTITRMQCRRVALKESAPLNSPRELRHWRACQTCAQRPKQAGVALARVVKTVKRTGKRTGA